MNNKRKNNTNRSLQKKVSINRPYHIPKELRKQLQDNKNDKDIRAGLSER